MLNLTIIESFQEIEDEFEKLHREMMKDGGNWNIFSSGDSQTVIGYFLL